MLKNFYPLLTYLSVCLAFSIASKLAPSRLNLLGSHIVIANLILSLSIETVVSPMRENEPPTKVTRGDRRHECKLFLISFSYSIDFIAVNLARYDE